MKNPKISFLIAAHNEEKVLGKTLSNLVNIPYDNYEILLGLDGCTDRTEEIVKSFQKKFKNISYEKLNLRSGKPDVINKIIKKAKGSIIVINDADWIFTVKDKKSFLKLLSVFENEEVGGIAESFPVEWSEERNSKANLGYKMVATGTYFWLEFQKKNFIQRKKGLGYLKTPKMFLTNIFRKELYQENSSLGDDFERTAHIMSKGKDIVIFEDPSLPRMIATYDTIGIKDILKQKIRTAIARGQLKESKETDPQLVNYYSRAVPYIFFNSWKKNLRSGFLVSFWLSITALGEAISKFKKTGTKKGWTLRAKR